MARFSIKEFEDDYEFEEYLANSCKWENWSLFQRHIVTMPHKTIGLYDSERMEMVAAAALSYLRDDDLIYIHLFQVRDDLRRLGYGSQLLKMIEKLYAFKYSGFKLQYTNGALKFWLNHGFEFADDMNFLIK